MRYATRSDKELRRGLEDAPAAYSTALTGVIHELDELAEEMAFDGFTEEAASLKTTVGDLQWQYEEAIDKELAAQWPGGPRRPIRSPNKARWRTPA